MAARAKGGSSKSITASKTGGSAAKRFTVKPGSARSQKAQADKLLDGIEKRSREMRTRVQALTDRLARP